MTSFSGGPLTEEEEYLLERFRILREKVFLYFDSLYFLNKYFSIYCKYCKNKPHLAVKFQLYRRLYSTM
jgi:hypothetical protein